MFIDDERHPVTDDWVVVRTSQVAIDYVWHFGCPVEISFDHDLGGEDTAMIFVKEFEGFVLDGMRIPDNFKFSVHSQNPIGAENIKNRMNNIINWYKDNTK